MEEQIDKATLLDKIYGEYAAFEALLAPLTQEQMTTPGVTELWSIKDVLAHLNAWQRRLLDLLQAAAQGKEPAVPTRELTDADVERLNAQFYEVAKLHSLDEIHAAFRSAHQQVAEAIQALSDDDLTTEERFPWMRGTPLLAVIRGNTDEHYQEHRVAIQSWLDHQR